MELPSSADFIHFNDFLNEPSEVGADPATEIVEKRPMNRPADVWSVILAEKDEPHFHPVCKYPSVVLTDQFSCATSHGAVGGFCTGGLPCPPSKNMVYFEVEILEVETLTKPMQILYTVRPASVVFKYAVV